MTKIVRLNDLQISVLRKTLTGLLRSIENEIGAHVQVGAPETEHLIWLRICHTEIRKILKKLED